MNKRSNNKILIPIAVFISFVLGAIWTYLVINQLDKGTILTSNVTAGSYTINENSIADAVAKIYDATVVIKTSLNGTDVATGTGFVYKVDGSTAYVMTNNHVVSAGNGAKIIFSDGTMADTKILGGDTYADIAVLTVSASNIKQKAIIGKSENLRLGDTTFAVGAPLGDVYSGTVTKGIVSGKDRLVEVSFSGETSDYYMEVIQTDAALNPGNSGGPLCNINGEVIGVNALKLTKQEIKSAEEDEDYTVEGMGFAIPIEDALFYAEQIELNGKVVRPYIGISMLDITDSYNLWQAGINVPKDINSGVVIVAVEDASPAGSAGLQKGDIIVKINNEDLRNNAKPIAQFRYELYKNAPGDKIDVTYNRNGKEYKTQVTLQESK